MVLSVYYNDVQVTTAFHIQYTLAVNSKNEGSFDIPNVLGENFDTWEARKRVGVIKIYDDTDLEFQGRVVGNTNKDPMTVKLAGIIDKMDDDCLTEEEGKFIIDEFIVKAIPTDANLKVINPDGDPDVDQVVDDPGLTDNFFEGAYPSADNTTPARYATISDATTKEDSETWTPADHPTLVNTSKHTGDETDIQTENDGNKFTWQVTSCENEGFCKLPILKTPATGQTIEIGKDSMVTEIEIDVSGVFYASYVLSVPRWRNLDLWWSIDGTTLNHYIKTWSIRSALASNGVDTFLHIVIPVSNDPDSDNTALWFTRGVNYLEDGWLVFRTNSLSNAFSQACCHDLDYAKVIIRFSTADFEPISRRIRDTLNDGSGFYDVLKLDNDTADDFYNLNGKGINKKDKVSVSIGWLEAIRRCDSGLNLNVPTIETGVDQNYGSVYKYIAFKQLCDDQNLLYYQHDFTTTEGDDDGDIIAINEDDIADATVTYDASNDPPSLSQNVISEDNEYGSIQVRYYDGITGKIYATTPPADPRNHIMDAKWIITETKALEYGKRWAEYYSKKHYSIELNWGYTPTNKPYIGTKYNITLQIKSGENVTTKTYENQLCRRITKYQETNLTPIITQGWFGGGNTPADEKMGQWQGSVNHKRELDECLRSTGQFQPVTRYSQLNGIPSTFTPIEHNNDYHSETYITAAAKLNSLAAPDGSVAMNNQKLTGLAAGANAGDSVRYEQLHDAVTVSAPISLSGQAISLVNDAAATITTIEAASATNSAVKIPTSKCLYDHAALTTTAHGGLVPEYVAHTYFPYNGFAGPVGGYGGMVASVLQKDGSADLECSVCVPLGGTFKIRVYGVSWNTSGTVALTIYARKGKSTSGGNWDINGDGITLTLSNTIGICTTIDSDDTITVNNGEIIGIQMHKGASSNTSGTLMIQAISVVRQ